MWEAAMFAGNRHLDNLLWIVDANGLQIDGTVDEVCSLEPLKGKFEAFHFHVIEADGHDFGELLHAYEEARKTKGQPSVVIARTVKGKGVSFMENQVSWHGKAPDATQSVSYTHLDVYKRQIYWRVISGLSRWRWMRRQ